ncbi:hypothetical protein GIB67_029606 [Kingdonia uniflora]|uniref:Uncharacterized protein n=1 Tax=Kingdonia uniflora TaxID=39325 RepID=A0A7J7LLB7_9MAGN|nr:hypothetical protein GIB67_029606 [Kingdonia uniflora]
MVSDSDLIIRLREFLQSSDLNTTTTAIVRRKLEEEFDVDLSDKKAFIREQVDLFLQSQNEEKPEPEGEDSSGEEEKPNVKSEPNGSVSKEHGDYSGDESEDEAEEEEEEEGATSKRRTVRKKQVSKKEGNSDVKKKGGGGFTKVCSLSPQLQEFLGIPECARTEVVKQIWAYIREKNLQDPSNRRNILCDEALHALFRVDSINMFQMTKALSKHIWPLESEDAYTSEKEEEEEEEDGSQKFMDAAKLWL